MLPFASIANIVLLLCLWPRSLAACSLALNATAVGLDQQGPKSKNVKLDKAASEGAGNLLTWTALHARYQADLHKVNEP